MESARLRLQLHTAQEPGEKTRRHGDAETRGSELPLSRNKDFKGLEERTL